MSNNQENLLQLMRGLSIFDQEIYNETNIALFRPSYEYIISRETRSCQHCRSLIYNQTSDIKALSLLEILNAHYNKSFDTNDTAKDVIFKAYAKTFDIFGFIKRDKIKSSTENLKRSLKISDKVLTIPILHRCNKCYKAWGIHFEMRHRLSNAPPIFNQSFDSIPFYLPKVNNFLNGLIFLNDNSEKTYINNHILDVKKMFINDKEIQLITAKKNIAMGNIGEALLNLGSFTNLPENRFFYNSVLQLQSRHSNCRQEKIKGTLSHQEETLELNKISSSTIALIDEINKYKNM